MTFEELNPFVVVDAENFRGYITNCYKTEEEAIQRALEEELIHDTVLKVTNWEEVKQLQAKYEADYIKDSLKEIDEETYYEKLSCLPPLNWGMHKGINSFFMSEFWHDSITDQYADCNGKYYTKRVNYRDKSTWINAQELTKLKSA